MGEEREKGRIVEDRLGRGGGWDVEGVEGEWVNWMRERGRGVD